MTMLLEEAAFTSKHLKGSAELLLIIPIKPGFVHAPETMSYATRLKDLLRVFFEFRKRTADISLKNTPQPIELLEIIYAAQWTVLEQERKLLVAVTFDRSWEEYFAQLQTITGFLLDALFMHCIGYDGHTSLDGFASFTDWIRSHQRPTDFLFQSSPDLTTRDIRSLRQLARNLGAAASGDDERELKEFASAHRILNVMGEVKANPDDGIPPDDDLRLALQSLYEFRRFFPVDERVKQRDAERSAQEVYDQAIASLLDPIFELLEERYANNLTLEQFVEKLVLPASEATRWITETVYPTAKRARNRIQLVEAAHAALVPVVPPGCIQANILRPIPEQRHGALLLIQCHGEDGLRKLLTDQIAGVTWEQGTDAVPAHGVFCSLALTYGGLTRARLPTSVLTLFPKEFREGMEQRAALLGDIGEPNHPKFWRRPLIANDNGAQARLSLHAVDAVVLLQGNDPSEIAARIEAIAERGDTHYSVAHVQDLKREKLDAFGLREGFSQPHPEFILGDTRFNKGAAKRDRVPLGEILLGHADRHNIVATCARETGVRELFQNSTFLVVRKLEQDAELFERMLAGDGHGGDADDAPDARRSALVGRDVAELNRAANFESVCNDFDYEDERAEERSSSQSHARLANPRARGKSHAVSWPRILRRGFAYDDRESPADRGRGLMFMAFNASITSQYETIQRWLNAGNVTGLFSWQNDLLTGAAAAINYPRVNGGACPHGAAGPAAGQRPQQLTKLRWGLYLFVPTKQAMDWLRHSAAARAPELDVAAGRELIAHLEALAAKNRSEAMHEWKRFMEDPVYDLQAGQIWAAIRANGGELMTPYGHLVASWEGARRVLCNDGRDFSVDVYGQRLEETMAPHYLGLDAYTPQYQALSAANACFHEALTVEIAYNDGFEVAQEVIRHHAHQTDSGKKLMWIENHFAKPVIRGLAKRWFGLPDEMGDGVDWFEHLIDVSRYSFQPHPPETLGKQLREQLRRMRVENYQIGGSLGAALREKLAWKGDERSRDRAIRSALVGGIAGFSAPAVAQIMSVLDKWLESGEIGWVSARTRFNGAPASDLLRMLLEALARRPVPPQLYRTDRSTQARVIVGVGSVYRDVQERRIDGVAGRPEAWLFGGNHAWDREGLPKAPHACPARDAGLHAVLGALTALLRCSNLERESRLVISFDAPPANGAH